MFEDEKIAKVVSLIKESAKPARKPRAKPSAPLQAGATMYINNSGEVSGQIAGGDIHNHYAKPPARPRIVVTPGVGVIDEAQKATITALRLEWITVYNSIKQRPLTDAAAWSRINKAAGVTSYHQIPAERFELVMAWIRKQIAMLRNMKSAPTKDDGWRRAKIVAIKARAKNQFADPDFYKPHIKKSFGHQSLTDLSTEQLRRTYNWIMGKEAPPAGE